MLNRISDYLPVSWSAQQKSRATSPAPAAVAASTVQAWGKSMEEFVKNHPGASLAAAFCVGVTVAWWIKRR